MINYHIVKRNWLKAILAFLILGFFLTGGAAAANQQSQAEVTSKSSLWSVEARGNTIYLLGSLHVLKSDAYPLAAAIEEAYASSRKVVFENLTDGTEIILHPNDANPLHKKPIKATVQSGYFYCEGSNPADGPDYYFGDVLAYNHGYELVDLRGNGKDGPPRPSKPLNHMPVA